MGIFNYYMKPGKGVDKNEPEKHGILLFIDVIIHKFGKFIGANCLYTLTSVIWIALLYLFFSVIISGSGMAERIAASIGDVDSAASVEEIQNTVTLILRLMTSVGIFVLWGSGPSSAAYSYIVRCFTRREHVWVVSDGKDKLRENFKQGMIVVLIDAIVIVFGINAAIYYNSLYSATHSFIWLFLSYATWVVFAVYTMMHPYIYQIMTTFECKTGAIYKNAFLLTFAKLPINFILTIMNLVIIFILFNLLSPIIASVILCAVGLCFTRYIMEFCATRVIERSMLNNSKTKTAKIEYEENHI